MKFVYIKVSVLVRYTVAASYSRLSEYLYTKQKAHERFLTQNSLFFALATSDVRKLK